MEYCPGSLREIIDYTRMKKRVFSLQIKINLLLQIACAVGYLHTYKEPVFHGNLHPGNILISSTLTPLLSDLFLVTTEQHVFRKQYTSSFIAPECRKENNPSAPSDIYSLGCIILYVLTDGEREVTPNMDLSIIESEGIQMMIRRCCNENPSVGYKE